MRFTLIGAGLGLAWGLVMRAWMRYITTSPEFSWVGTLMIVLASCCVGALLGFTRSRREVGGSGWWRFSLLSLLLLGAGGSVMWPTVIVGGLAIGWARSVWLRAIGLLLAAALQIPTIQDAILDNSLMTGPERLLAILWYVPMIALETWGFSVCFAPRSDEAPDPSLVKRMIFTIPTVVMVSFSALVLGVAGM